MTDSTKLQHNTSNLNVAMEKCLFVFYNKFTAAKISLQVGIYTLKTA